MLRKSILSTDGLRQKCQPGGKKWKMPWLNAFVKGGFQNKIVQDFDVLGIPKPILVNPDGIIVATEEELRGENLEKTLAKYLGDVAGRTSRN